VKVFLDGDEKQKAQALKLQETIEDCREVVNRVAPKTRYSEIMAEIAGMIDSWRKARVESIR